LARDFIDLVLEVEDQLLTQDIRQKVRRWVNIAQREIGGSFPWSWLECEFTTPNVLDRPNIYTLPPDFYAPLGVRYRSSSGAFSVLRVITTENEDAVNPDQSVTADIPSRAMFTGRTLQLNPAPTVAGGLVVLRALRTPPEMVADSDTPIIPEVHRDVLISGAVRIGSRWLWDDKGDQDRARNDFNVGLAKMIQIEKGGTAHNENMGLDSNWLDMMNTAGSSVT